MRLLTRHHQSSVVEVPPVPRIKTPILEILKRTSFSSIVVGLVGGTVLGYGLLPEWWSATLGAFIGLTSSMFASHELHGK